MTSPIPKLPTPPHSRTAKPTLNTRIIRLHNTIRSRKRIPSRTGTIKTIIINQPLTPNLILLLQKLQRKALKRMPPDMAMHEPIKVRIVLEEMNKRGWT